jgi:pilus assembly protein TadC
VTLTWLLLAAALAMAGGGTRLVPSRSAIPLHSLQCVAAGAVALGSLAVFGVGSGLVVATVVAPVAAVAVAYVHRRPQRVRVSRSLALALDHVATALRAGQPQSVALVLAAPAAGGACGDRLAQVGGLLRLGADPNEAWRVVGDDPVLAPVAAAAVRSAASGVRLAGAFEQLAVDVRAQLRAAGQARAERTGVFVAAPLGLCFLPSFVCLGIVPTVVGIAGAALSGAT